MLSRSVIFLVLLFLLLACSRGDPQKAWELIDQGALIIDVRTPQEFQSGHLRGAKLIPISQLSARLSELGNNKSRPVVLYCESGGRSARGEKILRANGFEQVVNGGGYRAMQRARK